MIVIFALIIAALGMSLNSYSPFDLDLDLKLGRIYSRLVIWRLSLGYYLGEGIISGRVLSLGVLALGLSLMGCSSRGISFNDI